MQGVDADECVVSKYYIILPYAPGELQMESETEGCLNPCGGHIGAQVAVNSIPPEPQLSWLSGRYMIMPF
jgi:hypothetical protein